MSEWEQAYKGYRQAWVVYAATQERSAERRAAASMFAAACAVLDSVDHLTPA